MSERDIVKKQLEQLRQQLASKSSLKCLETLEITTEYFDGPVTTSQISEFHTFMKETFEWTKSAKIL